MLDLVNWMEKVAAKFPSASLVLRAEVRGCRVTIFRPLQSEPSTNVVARTLRPDLPSRNNTNGQPPFYSIPELAVRWRCSRGTVYNRLRFAGAKVLDFASAGKKGKKLVPALTIVQMESKHLKALP